MTSRLCVGYFQTNITFNNCFTNSTIKAAKAYFSVLGRQQTPLYKKNSQKQTCTPGAQNIALHLMVAFSHPNAL